MPGYAEVLTTQQGITQIQAIRPGVFSRILGINDGLCSREIAHVPHPPQAY